MTVRNSGLWVLNCSKDDKYDMLRLNECSWIYMFIKYGMQFRKASSTIWTYKQAHLCLRRFQTNRRNCEQLTVWLHLIWNKKLRIQYKLYVHVMWVVVTKSCYKLCSPRKLTWFVTSIIRIYMYPFNWSIFQQHKISFR